MSGAEVKQRVTMSNPGEREIRFERVVDAPRDQLWRALTQAAWLAECWGRGHPLSVEHLQVEHGGRYRFVEHTPGGAQAFEGKFREVIKPERLVQTFEWDGIAACVAQSTTTLQELGGGLTQLVTRFLFHTAEDRDGILQSLYVSGAERAAAGSLANEIPAGESPAALDRVLAALSGGAASESVAKQPRVKRVAFTVYPVTDVARARKFYEETLGLSVGMHGGRGGMFWVEYDLPGGGCFAITNASGEAPSAAAGGTIALEAADLGSFTAELRQAGVSIKGDEIRGPRCRMAVCLDSEGNSIVLHQLDPSPA